jgi:hypothetical protein
VPPRNVLDLAAAAPTLVAATSNATPTLSIDRETRCFLRIGAPYRGSA